MLLLPLIMVLLLVVVVLLVVLLVMMMVILTTVITIRVIQMYIKFEIIMTVFRSITFPGIYI